MKKQKILQPQYVQKFQCIGGECEDICCRDDWRVFVEKSIYKLYKKCPDAKMREKLSKYITRNRINPSDDTYAKFKMTNNGYCNFLDKDMFCSIQRNLGENYLSLTCFIYPRNCNIVNNIYEKSLHMSCIEAAKLALLNTDLMKFDLTEENSQSRILVSSVLDTDKAKTAHKAEQYFTEIRNFSIFLMQNRLYPLWQRLIILGLFCNNLDSLIAENKNNEIIPLITAYLEHLKTGKFHDELEDIPNKWEVQLTVIREITAHRNTFSKHSRFKECFSEAMQGINYSDEALEEEIISCYKLAYENYYQPFLNKHEYILENYLVNYIFENLFPFGRIGKIGNNVFEQYTLLVIHYSMIKTLLIGMSGFYKENFNTGHILKLIQSLSRAISHSPPYLKSIIDCLKSNNMNSMTYMSILIKT